MKRKARVAAGYAVKFEGGNFLVTKVTGNMAELQSIDSNGNIVWRTASVDDLSEGDALDLYVSMSKHRYEYDDKRNVFYNLDTNSNID
jgi:hypothetical protein